MSISTARSAWAIACCCTSWLALAAPLRPAASRAEPSPAERSLELELELARKPGLYLRVDPAAGRLEIKVRGLTLDAVDLGGAALLLHRQRGAAVAEPKLPAVWTATSVSDREERLVVEAGRLRRLAAEEGEEDAAAGATQPAPAADSLPPDPPASYRVQLTDGWQLRVGRSVPRAGRTGGVGLAWARLRAGLAGTVFEPPDVLALALSPEDARRIHHLFRPGLQLLVVTGTPTES